MKFDEMMEKFEILMNHTTTQTQYKDAMQELPSTPPNKLMLTDGTSNHTPHSEPSPPTKKPNNNSSPHRNIYALFRQPAGKPPTKTSSNNTQRTSRQLYPPETSQMETDEEGHTPAPGAKPGTNTSK
jgi:hypothetical protein